MLGNKFSPPDVFGIIFLLDAPNAVGVMIIKDNILNLKENNYYYSLRDLRSRKFPVYYKNNRTIILNYESKNLSEFLELQKIASLRYHFFLETRDEVINILKKN